MTPPPRALAPVTMAALLLGACADDSDGGDQSAALAVPATAVDDAASLDGEFAVVEGCLLAAPGSPHRLCAAIAESYPPQCGGANLAIIGLAFTQVTRHFDQRGDS